MKQIPFPCVFVAGFLTGASSVCVFRMLRRRLWYSRNVVEERDNDEIDNDERYNDETDSDEIDSDDLWY